MIYGYQSPVYDSLRKTFHRHQRAIGIDLPIRARNHTLIVGGTGTGKTHVAGKVAKELNWATFTINVSGWICLGARETPTWHGLVKWLADIDEGRPAVVILDELDKIWGEDSWTRYLRAELFSLLDGSSLPMTEVTIKVEDGEDAAGKVNKAEANLKNLLVIGCGAFQGVHEEKPCLGFGKHEKKPHGASKLAQTLQRELVNRFAQDIMIIPEPTRADYEAMIEKLAPALPDDVAQIVREIGPSKIERALEDKAAARFGENLLSTALDILLSGEDPQPWEPVEIPNSGEVEIPDPKDVEMPTQEEIDASAEAAALWDEKIG